MPPATSSFRGGRAVLSLRRNQVASASDQTPAAIDNNNNDLDFDRFQSHVTDQLFSLSDIGNHPLPSFPFLHKLFDSFLSCEHEFKNLLLRNPTLVCKPAVDRLLSELLDRTVKALDICNELTDALQTVKHWNRHADIAATALTAATFVSDGHLNRAKKALLKLLSLQQETISATTTKTTERSWSFLSKNINRDNLLQATSSSCSSSRSLSLTPSAGKQLQAMSENLTPPRSGSDQTATFAVYTMSSVLVFTMWVVVVAFRSPTSTPVVPAGVARMGGTWGPAMALVQERVKGAGRLVEVVGVERCGREVMEAVMAGGARGDVTAMARELGLRSGVLEEGVGLFERRLRELFHRVVSSREHVTQCLANTTTTTSSFIVM